MNHALEGIVVLDLSRVLAGPWCTQMLADLGAKVIKVERPNTGDDTRQWGPPWIPTKDANRLDASYYATANRNKQSITIDIASEHGQRLIQSLAIKADVVVENFKVRDLSRYGLGYEQLKEINPRLIYCSITGYGQDGPYAERPGYDFVFQGEGGLMSVTGERDDMPGGGPQKVGVAVVDLTTGLYASTAILAALQHRSRTDRGQHIDLALLDCVVALGANQATTHLINGSVPKRYGNAHAVMVPYQVFRTSDSYIIVASGNDAQWQRFCEAIERFDLRDDERFSQVAGRIFARDTLVPDIEKTIAQKSKAWWLERLRKFDVPHGPINDYSEVFAHPQVRHRQIRVDIPDSRGGSLPTVANPIKFSDTPIAYRNGPPQLGENTREVLSQMLGLSAEELQQLHRDQVI